MYDIQKKFARLGDFVADSLFYVERLAGPSAVVRSVAIFYGKTCIMVVLMSAASDLKCLVSAALVMLPSYDNFCRHKYLVSVCNQGDQKGTFCYLYFLVYHQSGRGLTPVAKWIRSVRARI